MKWSDLKWHEKLQEIFCFFVLWFIFSLFFAFFDFLFYVLCPVFVPFRFIPVGGLIFFGLFAFDNR